MKKKTGTTQSKVERNLVQRLRQWQSVEDDSLRMTKEVRARTKNPLIQLVMEIIAHDSAMHRRVQQFIIDSIEKEQVSLEPEELRELWDVIEKHSSVEKDAIALAEEARKCTDLYVPQYLFGYLLEDERKHDLLLDRLV